MSLQPPAPADQATASSTDRVFDSVRELRALAQIATRETVAELTGLRLGIVDDRLRTLVDDGRLKRLLRGVYELVEVFPATRAISKTVLPNRMVKLDIGDDVVTLTPEEHRTLAELFVGAAGMAVMIHSTNQHLFLATEVAARVDRIERAQAEKRDQTKAGKKARAT